jgi:single-strand DNA-binding protein
MAEGMASLSIIGSVGRDAEVKQAGGTTVLEFNVAVNSWAKSGETTAWYRVSMFGARGEKLASMIRKGDRIGVSGRLVPREYQGKDGASKLSLDLKADSITLLGGKRDAEPQRAAQFSRAPEQGELGDAMGEDGCDQLPF